MAQFLPGALERWPQTEEGSGGGGLVWVCDFSVGDGADFENMLTLFQNKSEKTVDSQRKFPKPCGKSLLTISTLVSVASESLPAE